MPSSGDREFAFPASLRDTCFLRFVPLGSVVLLASIAIAQSSYTHKEITISGLPSLMAKTDDRSDVLLTSFDTILHDREICCGKDSALGDTLAAAGSASLKEVADKVQGRHLLEDGRPIAVTVHYLTTGDATPERLLGLLTAKRAAVMEWNSRLYVLYGMTYLESSDYSTNLASYAIDELLLIDTRYSDARRKVRFKRESQDLSRVQGVLFVEWKLQ